MKTHRLARVAEVIREVASETILFKLKDPRIRMVTVLRVEVSGDLQHAKVYVSVMGTDAEQKETLRALKGAAGVVQSQLADRLKTRFIPVIDFVLDHGIKKSMEVSRLIQEALANSSSSYDRNLEQEPLQKEESSDDEEESDEVRKESSGEPS